MRFLTPTENNRLNELIGFLCITAAVLVALSLLSYDPRDPAFNVSAASGGDHVTQNWMGPVGAYASDLLFQVFGFAAFLLPVALSILGYRWARSQMIDSHAATLGGYALLLLSFPSLLAMIHFPDVRGAVPAGGLLGTLVSHGLQTGFNFWGALLMAVALFIVALFLTTSFSFSAAHAWASGTKGPIGKIEKIGILRKAQARWHAWQDEREQRRNRRAVEQRRLAGRKPVTQLQGRPEVVEEQAKAIHLKDESDVFRGKKAVVEDAEEEREKTATHKAPIMFANQEKPEKPKKAGEPKIEKMNANYKLPGVQLLREGAGGHKLDEDELKFRARAIEEKCHEFGVEGRVTQINPGPVVTTFEFKPEAGIKYSRIIGLTEDLCLALKAESILIERIPGKSTIGIEVPNDKRETIALREIIEATEFANSPSKLTLAMGRDLHGRIRITDLASMPHLLIAGSTGPARAYSSIR